MYASSHDVAKYFEKQHAHVMRDIETLLDEAPAIAPNFETIEKSVKVGFGYRKDRD